MKKKLLLIFISSLITLSAYTQKKQICISFNDLPFVSYGVTDTTVVREMMDSLIYSLTENKIEAVGFVNEGKMYSKRGIDLFQVHLLKSWIDNELELGNHGYTHTGYNMMNYYDFTQDIIKGEVISNQLLGDKNKTLKYFRHPHLQMGNTKEKVDKLIDFLAQREYVIAPVTINGEDETFAKAYKIAKGMNYKDTMSMIGNDYIYYIEEMIKYYELQSQALFRRNISHILQLHANNLNATYMDDLITMMKRNDYEFISLEEALKDKVYASRANLIVHGDWALSWLSRWALLKGEKMELPSGKPETPDYIKKLTE